MIVGNATCHKHGHVAVVHVWLDTGPGSTTAVPRRDCAKNVSLEPSVSSLRPMPSGRIDKQTERLSCARTCRKNAGIAHVVVLFHFSQEPPVPSRLNCAFRHKSNKLTVIAVAPERESAIEPNGACARTCAIGIVKAMRHHPIFYMLQRDCCESRALVAPRGSATWIVWLERCGWQALRQWKTLAMSSDVSFQSQINARTRGFSAGASIVGLITLKRSRIPFAAIWQFNSSRVCYRGMARAPCDSVCLPHWNKL